MKALIIGTTNTIYEVEWKECGEETLVVMTKKAQFEGEPSDSGDKIGAKFVGERLEIHKGTVFLFKPRRKLVKTLFNVTFVNSVA